MEGETIVAKAHQHHLSLVLIFLIGLAYFLWGIFTSDVPLNFSSFDNWVIIIALALIGMLYFQHINTHLVVTNRRILAINWEGIGKFTKLDLDKLQDVSVDQGTIGKKLGYGGIILTCMNGKEVYLSNVSDPQAFQQKILEQMAQLKGAKLG